MQTVAFHTLGCKLNFSETSTIARQFRDAGWQRADFPAAADVYVVNTCSVTENADKECKQIVNRAMKANPEGKVIIVGCYAQLKPEEIANIPGVDLVLGATEKFNVLRYLDNLKKSEDAAVMACEIEEATSFVSAYSSGDRTRVFLKVQDGCDYFCSFCTIPLARGRSRSSDIENILENAKEIATSGAKEIVLTGVNIGDFKTSNGETFLDLIKELDKTNGISRFRISSIEPNLLSNEIIEFVASSKKFVNHFLKDNCMDMPKLYTTLTFNSNQNIQRIQIDASCHEYSRQDKTKASRVKEFIDFVANIIMKKPEVSNAPPSDIIYY